MDDFQKEIEESYARLKRQHLSGQVEVTRTYGRGGLWGQGLSIFEWEVYSPSRGADCHYCAVFMPSEYGDTGDSVVSIAEKHSEDGDILHFGQSWRLEIVVGHHEGSFTVTLPELKEQVELSVSEYGPTNRNSIGQQQSLAVIEKLMQFQVEDDLICSEAAASRKIPDGENKMFLVDTGISGTAEEAERD